MAGVTLWHLPVQVPQGVCALFDEWFAQCLKAWHRPAQFSQGPRAKLDECFVHG